MPSPLPPDILHPLYARDMWLWRNRDVMAVPVDNPAITALVTAARDRFDRAENLIRTLFSLPDNGVAPITSPLIALAECENAPRGRWFIKGDHALPVAGSIKARGGFHEVIAHAETLAIAHGLIPAGSDLTALAGADARALFARHRVLVGSTGNLGMSIGLCAGALGFRTEVHMSTDAKAWKKDRLRAHGAKVIEHRGDYGAAVAAGRALAEADPLAHFVDDEASLDMFSGYACAAFELQRQLQNAGVTVDAAHPLVVYLPCGVGGAPGGIAYGLKLVFGALVHCVFAEPTESPCMLVQLASGSDTPISVYDIGLTNRTALDGLAVAQASAVVAPLMRHRIDGIYTVTDAQAHRLLQQLHATTGIAIEPSAATALAGPSHLAALDPENHLRDATHISWTTGGSLVPPAEFAGYLRMNIC